MRVIKHRDRRSARLRNSGNRSIGTHIAGNLARHCGCQLVHPTATVMVVRARSKWGLTRISDPRTALSTSGCVVVGPDMGLEPTVTAQPGGYLLGFQNSADLRVTQSGNVVAGNGGQGPRTFPFCVDSAKVPVLVTACSSRSAGEGRVSYETQACVWRFRSRPRPPLAAGATYRVIRRRCRW
jgi:hypothetical protein